jgi:hypothetical protein
MVRGGAPSTICSHGLEKSVDGRPPRGLYGAGSDYFPARHYHQDSNMHCPKQSKRRQTLTANGTACFGRDLRQSSRRANRRYGTRQPHAVDGLVRMRHHSRADGTLSVLVSSSRPPPAQRAVPRPRPTPARSPSPYAGRRLLWSSGVRCRCSGSFRPHRRTPSYRP